MTEVRRIIFVDENGISRAPMAKALFTRVAGNSSVEVLCRGLVVAFPEPLNQKAEAVMISNEIEVSDFTSEELMDDDITDETLVFTMDRTMQQQVLSRFAHATEDNTFVLGYYVGDELETMDPYGGSLQTYGLCFETLKETVVKLFHKLQEEGQL